MPAGRPTKYKEEYNEQVMKLCLLGATDVEIADFFNVDPQTVYTWRKKEPQFLEAVKEGKEKADARVSESLFHRALGYSHKATEFAKFNGTITDEKEYTKHYPPETLACIYWLKNRQSAKWRDKTEVEHKGEINVKSPIDEIKRRIAGIADRNGTGEDI